MILNLGCGNEIIEGATNHDRHRHRKEVDQLWDLNLLPWPWEDNSYKVIYAINVFEHLSLDMVQIMDECWRILKPGGKITVKVPNCEDPVACWGDPTHRRPYHIKSFELFDPERSPGKKIYDFYTSRKWELYRKEHAGNKTNRGVYSSLRFHLKKRAQPEIVGKIAEGYGHGAEHVTANAKRLYKATGVTIHPGTLNIEIGQQPHWGEGKAITFTLKGNRHGAWLYAAELQGEKVWALRHNEGIRENPCKVEIIAAENLRKKLGLQDGDAVKVELKGAKG